MKKTFFVSLFIGLGLFVFANDLMLNISRTIGSTYQEVQQNLGKPLKESMMTMPDGQTKRFLFYSGIQVHIGLRNPYKLTLFKDVSGMIVRIEIENAMYWYG